MGLEERKEVGKEGHATLDTWVVTDGRNLGEMKQPNHRLLQMGPRPRDRHRRAQSRPAGQRGART